MISCHAQSIRAEPKARYAPPTPGIRALTYRPTSASTPASVATKAMRHSWFAPRRAITKTAPVENHQRKIATATAAAGWDTIDALLYQCFVISDVMRKTSASYSSMSMPMAS